MTYGFSRDDVGRILETYFEKKILESDPFARLDQAGVGKLIRFAVAEGRRTRPDIKLGICGEHGGRPVVRRVLPQCRPELRFLLALPRADRPPRSGAGPRQGAWHGVISLYEKKQPLHMQGLFFVPGAGERLHRTSRAKRKSLKSEDFRLFCWQPKKDSNPHKQSQSLSCLPLHNSAVCAWRPPCDLYSIQQIGGGVKHFFQKSSVFCRMDRGGETAAPPVSCAAQRGAQLFQRRLFDARYISDTPIVNDAL